MKSEFEPRTGEEFVIFDAEICGIPDQVREPSPWHKRFWRGLLRLIVIILILVRPNGGFPWTEELLNA